uniref:(northern house mosquito) hypothetical protein n=1 Tax=Culex pipiens TaxID=7175 RepID=A0A8D8G3N4_CULPI
MDAQPIGDGAAVGQEPMAQDSAESLHGVYRFTMENLSHQKSFNVVAQCDSQERPIECKVERDFLVLEAWTGQVLNFYAKCADGTDQRIWRALQPVQLRIANRGLEGEYFWRWVRPDLRKARNGWVPLFCLNWKDVIDGDYGYVVNDSIKLEIVTK